MIGLVLAVLALLVLFDKLPGNEIAWIVVLVCGLLLLLGGIEPIRIPFVSRRPPPPSG